MINHGISTGALFLLVGIIYERRHTRMIAEYGGLAKLMPIYATFFLIMALSSIGLPLLNGFIGEFTILQGAFARNFWWAFAAATGIVLGAAYLLWLYQRVFFGEVTNPANKKLQDLTFREQLTLAPLVDPRPLDRPLPEAVLRRHPDALREDRRDRRRPDRRGAGAGARSRRPPARAGGRPPMTFSAKASDWILLSPELFLTAAGLLDPRVSRRSSGRRSEEFLGFLAIALGRDHGGCSSSSSRVAARRGRPRSSAAPFVVDNFALFFKGLDPAVAAADDPRLGAVRRAGAVPGRRVLRAPALRRRRHALHGLGQQPDLDLRRPRDRWRSRPTSSPATSRARSSRPRPR